MKFVIRILPQKMSNIYYSIQKKLIELCQNYSKIQRFNTQIDGIFFEIILFWTRIYSSSGIFIAQSSVGNLVKLCSGSSFYNFNVFYNIITLFYIVQVSCSLMFSNHETCLIEIYEKFVILTKIT